MLYKGKHSKEDTKPLYQMHRIGQLFDRLGPLPASEGYLEPLAHHSIP